MTNCDKIVINLSDTLNKDKEKLMGLLEKLFGKKKKPVEVTPEEEIQQEEAIKEEVLKEEARNITLEEVEKDLEELEKVEPVKKEEQPTVKVYHIKPHEKGWQIIADGATKATRVFQYQKEAVQYAKDENLDYILYRADGTVRE